MAGIPREFIDDLITRTDLADLIGRHVVLKRKGNNHHGLCPFHSEKTPSFTVNNAKGFYYCFGCGAHGNAIGFLMAHSNSEFLDAVDMLADMHGVSVPKSAAARTHNQETVTALTVLDKTATQYIDRLHDRNTSAHAARRYLTNRGISAAIIDRFAIGFAPDAWDTVLRTHPKQTVPLLIKTGLVLRNARGKTYDRFRKRIIFPIRNRRGQTLAFGGRVLDDGDTPKYLNSPETPYFRKRDQLYGIYEYTQTRAQHDLLFVVEGYMDVIALHNAGIPNVVATLGTACTEEHIKALNTHTKHIVLCFDGDAAGIRAADRAIDHACGTLDAHTQLSCLFLPEGEDPDSLVRTHGKDNFLMRARNAIPLATALYRRIAAAYPPESPEGRAQFLQHARNNYDTITAETHRAAFVETVARNFGLLPGEIAQKWQKQHTNVLPDTKHAIRPSGAGIKKTPAITALFRLLLLPELVDCFTDSTYIRSLYDDATKQEYAVRTAHAVCNSDTVRTWSLPHTDILAEVLETIECTDTIPTTAQLIEILRENNTWQALRPLWERTLAAHTDDMAKDAAVRECIELFAHMQKQARTHRRRLLTAKSEQGTLSAFEAKELAALFANHGKTVIERV